MLKTNHLVLLLLGGACVMGLFGCPPPNALHALTLSVTPAGAGTIRATPDAAVYLAGTEILLEALPKEGWEFRNWVGTGINTTVTPARLRIYSDQTISAVFVPAGSEGEGEGEGEPPQGIVSDPGFENGPDSAAWVQMSANFPFLICDEPHCGLLNGVGAHSGQYWTYFGNVPSGGVEVASISQNVALPQSGPATLEFYLAVPRADALFFFRVFLGRNLLFELTSTGAAEYETYQRVAIDISAFATGEAAALVFSYNNFEVPGAVIGVFVDDVQILTGPAAGG